MGRQVRFYMTHQDERDFLKGIRKRGSPVVIRNTFKKKDQMKVSSLKPVGAQRGEDDYSMYEECSQAKIIMRFFRRPSYYCINKTESEIIEFLRCRKKDEHLLDGRLWYDTQKVDGTKKRERFIKWAESVFRWIKNRYKIDSSGDYVGPDATKKAKQGKMKLGMTYEPIPQAEVERVLGISLKKRRGK